MRFIKSSALALTLCIAATVSASASATASASEKDSLASCIAAGSQVSAAVGAAQNADASREKHLGLQFCNAGLYHQGLTHYSKAMELVGGKLAQN